MSHHSVNFLWRSKKTCVIKQVYSEYFGLIFYDWLPTGCNYVSCYVRTGLRLAMWDKFYFLFFSLPPFLAHRFPAKLPCNFPPAWILKIQEMPTAWPRRNISSSKKKKKKRTRKRGIAVYRRRKAETIVDIPGKIIIERLYRRRITREFRKYFRKDFFPLFFV